jgi:hypothetical protein
MSATHDQSVEARRLFRLSWFALIVALLMAITEVLSFSRGEAFFQLSSSQWYAHILIYATLVLVFIRLDISFRPLILFVTLPVVAKDLSRLSAAAWTFTYAQAFSLVCYGLMCGWAIRVLVVSRRLTKLSNESC